MIRKNLYIAILCLTMIVIPFSSCDDLLEAKSGRQTAEEDYRLLNASDSVFSMFGLLTQLQKMGDSYVLLGELRGDLMTIGADAPNSLREINELNITSGNQIVSKKDFYAVINNCNYIIRNLDTTVVDKGLKLKRSQYAAVMAIRAWTYLQIALNYKTVVYYEEPVLTVADAEKSHDVIEIRELADRLIPGLQQIKDVPLPAIGLIGTYSAAYSLIPPKFVLGELYLWTSRYEEAARSYYELMYDKKLAISKTQISAWDQVNNTIGNTGTLNWINSLKIGYGEVVSAIFCPTDYGQTFLLDSLNNQRKIIPTDIALNNWKSQVYFLNDASSSYGDLRQYGSLAYDNATNISLVSSNAFTGQKTTDNLIYKYKINKQILPVCRASLVYLRYAEAVNRLNKPNLAFAVLKYGLNTSNLFNESIVPSKERSSPLPVYMQFTDARFSNNAGIRMRSLGNADKDTTFYRIPKLTDMLDSVRHIESLIEQELALETAFEGNRYHDLMRIAIRRIEDGRGDDESYLAIKIAAKHKGNAAAVKTRLMNRDNWYIR